MANDSLKYKYAAIGLPWRGSMATDVSDCKTAREVIEKAKLDFYVDKCELVGKMPITLNGDNTVNTVMGDFAYEGNIYRSCPNAYATYRTDKNVPLGIVKQKYEVVQNMDAFNFFDDAIGPDKAIWQTAGCFGCGQKVFISAKLPYTTQVYGDPIDSYLVFSNSHDGSSSINIMFTPIRVFCFNCLNAARKNADSYIRIRHTISAKDKLQQGADILNAAMKYVTEAKQLYETLYTIKMSDTQVMEYLTKLVVSAEELAKLQEYDISVFKRLINKDYMVLERTGISTRKANQISKMFDYYINGVAQDKIAGTAWGAYNAVTGYYSNKPDDNAEKRMDSLLYGGGSVSMSKAFNEALDLVEV